MTRLRTWMVIVFLIVLGFVAYGNTLRGVLFWDDDETVVNNVYLRSPSHIKEIFLSSYHSGSGVTVNFYRPLVTLSFMMDYHLWGVKPFGYHLGNVLVHILNAILIFLIFKALFQESRIPFLTALLFLVHPLHTEAVAYVSNRTDLMMFFFFLLGFWAYVRYRSSGRVSFLGLSVSAYILSILSKEMGIVLPLFLVAYDRLLVGREGFPFTGGVKSRRGGAGSPQAAYAVCAAVFVIYAVLRYTTLNFLKTDLLWEGVQRGPYSTDLWIRFLTFCRAAVTYLRLFFFPAELHMEYDRPIVGSRYDLAGWAAAGIFFGAIALILRWGRKEKRILFGQVWFLLGLLPTSGILVPSNNVMAEHFLYLPSAGFFLCIATAAVRAFESQRLRYFRPSMALAGIMLVVLLPFMTFKQNEVWSDPLTFYLDLVSKTTGSFRANNNAGLEYWRKGDMVKAEEYFLRSLAISPAYSVALNNMGYIYDIRGDYANAERFYRMSAQTDSDYLLARKNLANLYIRQGRYPEATSELTAVLQKFPYDAGARDLLRYIPGTPENLANPPAAGSGSP